MNRLDQIFVQLSMLVGSGIVLAFALEGIASLAYSRLPVDDARACFLGLVCHEIENYHADSMLSE